MGNEIMDLEHRSSQTASKLQKTQTDLDSTVTQMGYDVEHYRNLYEELKAAMNKNDQ